MGGSKGWFVLCCVLCSSSLLTIFFFPLFLPFPLPSILSSDSLKLRGRNDTKTGWAGRRNSGFWGVLSLQLLGSVPGFSSFLDAVLILVRASFSFSFSLSSLNVSTSTFFCFFRPSIHPSIHHIGIVIIVVRSSAVNWPSRTSASEHGGEKGIEGGARACAGEGRRGGWWARVGILTNHHHISIYSSSQNRIVSS